MIKYIISLVFLGLGTFTVKNTLYFIASFFELGAIFMITNSLKQVNKRFQILNNILMLLFNVQNMFLFFGGTYLLLVMLENTDSIHMLSGRIVTYVLGVLIVVISSFLPSKVFNYKKKWMHALILIPVILEIVFSIIIGFKYTPLSGYVSLCREWQNKDAMRKELESNKNIGLEDLDFLKKEDEQIEETKESQTIEEKADVSANEKKEEMTDVSENGTKEEMTDVSVNENTEELDSNKNIILIFTEGLSMSVIEDERNIMPNMKALADETISFENYYNHTFATYRGIQGQLYSGHQFDNYDKNNLTSIMDVLRDNGYYTAFINVEPNNKEFEEYQRNMGFDDVYSTTGYYTGDYDTDVINKFYGMYPDKSAYEMVFDYSKKFREENKKFFLVIYTAGTHASFDSYEQKYGDGSDAEINKFYDCDYSFGTFFNRFKESDLIKDTAFILTADHATFADEMFLKAFPKYTRIIGSCDRIPLYVYFKGKQQCINAAGRNSLDLAPTILDMLGIKAPNSFLGSSLFKEQPDKESLEYYMWDPDMLAYSGNEVLEYTIGEEAVNIRSKIAKYCAVATK